MKQAQDCLTAMSDTPTNDLVQRELLQQPPKKDSALKGKLLLLKVETTNLFPHPKQKQKQLNTTKL